MVWILSSRNVGIDKHNASSRLQAHQEARFAQRHTVERYCGYVTPEAGYRDSERLDPALEEDAFLPLHFLGWGAGEAGARRAYSDFQRVATGVGSGDAEGKVRVHLGQHSRPVVAGRAVGHWYVHQINDAVETEVVAFAFFGFAAKQGVFKVHSGSVSSSSQGVAPCGPAGGGRYRHRDFSTGRAQTAKARDFHQEV